jgi:hypothetical protein
MIFGLDVCATIQKMKTLGIIFVVVVLSGLMCLSLYAVVLTSRIDRLERQIHRIDY